MKTTITIYLDNGTKVELSLEEAIELRDKLNKLTPKKDESTVDFYRWLKDCTLTPWDPNKIYGPGIVLHREWNPEPIYAP